MSARSLDHIWVLLAGMRCCDDVNAVEGQLELQEPSRAEEIPVIMASI